MGNGVGKGAAGGMGLAYWLGCLEYFVHTHWLGGMGRVRCLVRNTQEMFFPPFEGMGIQGLTRGVGGFRDEVRTHNVHDTRPHRPPATDLDYTSK